MQSLEKQLPRAESSETASQDCDQDCEDLMTLAQALRERRGPPPGRAVLCRNVPQRFSGKASASVLKSLSQEAEFVIFGHPECLEHPLQCHTTSAPGWVSVAQTAPTSWSAWALTSELH